MRIVCVISSMRSGGAERVMSLLTGHWARTGNTVSLLTYEPEGACSFYLLDPRVAYQPLGLAHASRTIGEALRLSFRRATVLRRAISAAQPDVIVSFCAQMNVMTLAATRGFAAPVIVSERVEPAAHTIGRFWQFGRWLLYPFAHAVVVQTKSAENFFPPRVRRRCRLIPNPVPLPNLVPATRQLRILAVGRLNVQKGFDLLLEAYALIRGQHPEWLLRIVGEGEERAALQALARRLGVEDGVELPGLMQDIAAEYAAASVFALSSRYEGFPNALCEAMAAGLPVVAFACAGGVVEIVQDGANGLLVAPGDVVALAGRLRELVVDLGLRSTLGQTAKNITKRYAPGAVFAQWDSCIASVRSG